MLGSEWVLPVTKPSSHCWTYSMLLHVLTKIIKHMLSYLLYTFWPNTITFPHIASSGFLLCFKMLKQAADCFSYDVFYCVLLLLISCFAFLLGSWSTAGVEEANRDLLMVYMYLAILQIGLHSLAIGWQSNQMYYLHSWCNTMYIV